MEDVEQLLRQLHWQKTNEELQLAKEKLKELPEHQMSLLVLPLLDKALWDNAAELLIEMGYPRIKPILYEVLTWLQDINWPGSIRISEFLVAVGEPLVPYIKRAFTKSESDWNYWIITYVISKWEKGVMGKLSQDLLELAKGFDYDSAHIEALRLLVREELVEESKIKQIIDSKKLEDRNQDYFEDLIEIEQMLNCK
ncbi:DUF5071 domain-containing protein [Paenibacillus sp. NPDC056933]|uniref:DUF5071 domain-containing protein n=1 Tax=Paenibacillus sp. NPDC056933 TaxID=3345968 RepID=UPI00363943FA